MLKHIQPKSIVLKRLVKFQIARLIMRFLDSEIEPRFLDFLRTERQIPDSVLKYRYNQINCLRLYGEEYKQWTLS